MGAVGTLAASAHARASSSYLQLTDLAHLRGAQANLDAEIVLEITRHLGQRVERDDCAKDASSQD